MWLATPSTSSQQTPARAFGAKLNAGTSSLVGDAKATPTQEVHAEGAGGQYSVLTPRDTDLTKLKLFQALAAAKILTSRVAMAMESDWRTYFFDQLDQLHDAEDWDDDIQPVQIASVRTFLRSYIAWHPHRKPSLGLTERGNILAAWRENEGTRLTLEFFPEDQLNYILAAPDGNTLSRHSGNARVQSLQKFIAPFPQAEWFIFAGA